MKRYSDAYLIRKEIEKYYDEYKHKFNIIGDPYYLGLADGLDVAKRVIDSLQQEQPCEDLKKAARDYTDGSDWQLGENLEHIDAAFIAGAEWQAERLLKGSPMPEDTVIFQKGIEEGKRLMMEDAVEGKVFMSFAPGHNQMVMADVDLPTNTKVKIVIVKEEE